MKKKGFTLIELLAVIVILAVIALIATPMIMNYIEDARDGALESSVRNIIDVAETTYAKELLDNPNATPNVTFEELEYQGEQIDPENAKLVLNEDGFASIAVYHQNKCVYKTISDKDVILDKELTKEECMNKIGGTTQTIGVEDLIEKANGSDITDYNQGNKGEMYTFHHPATEQTGELTDYRYIGNVPNNYITFNNEVWRIIGVFEGRIKIIKDTSIGNLKWDYKQYGVGSSSSFSSNDWTDSQLMYMLNPTTFTLKKGYTNDGTYIRDANNKIVYQLGCNPAEANGSSYNCTANSWNLNEKALSQVDTVTWYLGGDPNYQGHSAETYYAFERGTAVLSGRQASWEGKVGLMYPSDYAYTYAYGVDDQCYSETHHCTGVYDGTPSAGWLYNNEDQWTLSPNSDYSDSVFSVYIGSILHSGTGSGDMVRPVVHLRSDIELTGSGTSDDPYQIVD